MKYKPKRDAFYDFKGKKLKGEALDTVDTLYKKYNAILSGYGYGAKYDLGNAQMFNAIGRNINKYYRFLHDKIHKFEGKTGEEAA